MRAVPLLLAVVALALSSCSSGGAGSAGSASSATLPATTAAATTPATPEQGTFERIPQIVDDVQPSVVAVLVSNGEGSGVIYSSDGTIVTNNHVVQGASSLQVQFATGERVGARVVATDPLSDLAVIKVDRTGLPPARFSTSTPVVGELAVAMGSPLGFENTVTAGIVSGLNRAIPASGAEGFALSDLIQTDAPISPGNSGGALVDAQSRVMGINVAYIPPQQSAVSIGFAIPASTAVDVIKQLLANGKAEHAFLGVRTADVTPQLAQRFGVDATTGLFVINVVNGSGAERAGLRPGDVILSIDGQTMRGVEDLLSLLRRHKPGDQVRIEILRGGKRETVTATLTNRPS